MLHTTVSMMYLFAVELHAVVCVVCICSVHVYTYRPCGIKIAAVSTRRHRSQPFWRRPETAPQRPVKNILRPPSKNMEPNEQENNNIALMIVQLLAAQTRSREAAIKGLDAAEECVRDIMRHTVLATPRWLGLIRPAAYSAANPREPMHNRRPWYQPLRSVREAGPRNSPPSPGTCMAGTK